MKNAHTLSRGMMISNEGPDGAGKTTALMPLAEKLRADGFEVAMTREPGGTPLAEKLREMVLHSPMDPLTESLLVFAARRDHVKQVIEPALARGAIVLCDRFTDSSFAYQGAGRGFDRGVLAQLESWVQEGLQPDLTLWYDLPAEVAAKRRGAARAADRFEQQDIDFFAKVRQGYVERAASHPKRFVRIDAERSQEEVLQTVLALVADRVSAFFAKAQCEDGPLADVALVPWSEHPTWLQEVKGAAARDGRAVFLPPDAPAELRALVQRQAQQSGV